MYVKWHSRPKMPLYGQKYFSIFCVQRIALLEFSLKAKHFRCRPGTARRGPENMRFSYVLRVFPEKHVSGHKSGKVKPITKFFSVLRSGRWPLSGNIISSPSIFGTLSTLLDLLYYYVWMRVLTLLLSVVLCKFHAQMAQHVKFQFVVARRRQYANS